ncbi:MAG TPA: hypothetical protein VK963_03365 [Candidatus Saccharimonadales bacterium]|nr:hypothetical protein [Candidatus Saccharimonadales bacterium]
MIIGVCGTFAAGKDAVAEYLATKGFLHVSTGDLLRAYIQKHQLGSLERDNLRIVANKIRAEKGGGYFAELALGRTRQPLVVSGIRTVGEVAALRQAGGHLIAVDAPINRRYQWAKGRGRLDHVTSVDDFKRQELAEEGHSPTDSQITIVISMANFNIANDGTLEQLHAKIDEVLERYHITNVKGQSSNGK